MKLVSCDPQCVSSPMASLSTPSTDISIVGISGADNGEAACLQSCFRRKGWCLEKTVLNCQFLRCLSYEVRIWAITSCFNGATPWLSVLLFLINVYIFCCCYLVENRPWIWLIQYRRPICVSYLFQDILYLSSIYYFGCVRLTCVIKIRIHFITLSDQSK